MDSQDVFRAIGVVLVVAVVCGALWLLGQRAHQPAELSYSHRQAKEDKRQQLESQASIARCQAIRRDFDLRANGDVICVPLW